MPYILKVRLKVNNGDPVIGRFNLIVRGAQSAPVDYAVWAVSRDKKRVI